MDEVPWAIRWRPQADRYARRLPPRLRDVLLHALGRPTQAKPLAAGGWAVRVAGLRAVIEIDRGQHAVIVLAVGPRGQVYRHAGCDHGQSGRARRHGIERRRRAREAGRTG